ncbi:MAG: RDD family protein [Nocardioides sp.]|jgi:uncharacterized RDD family membrane protein YckC
MSTSKPAYAAGRPEFATLTADDLVTGEAVALDLPPASLGARMVSGLIDVLVTVVLVTLLMLLTLSVTVHLGNALLRASMILCMITIFLVYPTAMETLTRGRSLGKLAMGLRTVRDDAGPISAQHAFVRALIGFVEIYVFTGAPAFFSALLSSRGKRLGDFAAGTYVVRERVRLSLPAPPVMPPPLAQWAASADMAALPVGLALAIRSFLQRAPEMEPGMRESLATRLAQQTDPYVAPKPPPYTPAEAYLAAVIASRRERDLARLTRESQLRQRLTSR